jgi:hypothetical protein
MRTFLVFFFPALFFISCSEEVKKEKIDPTGRWESVLPWDNNTITLTVRPDSTMLFKVKKLVFNGIQYFVSVGKWHVENDTLLVMEQFTDGRKYEMNELFPELTNTGSDTLKVIGLELSAKFIITKDSLYDIEADGKRSKEKIYIRK